MDTYTSEAGTLNTNVKYRHEYKYVINAAQKAILISRLPSVMSSDPYAGIEGVYRIRSLYFDDFYNSCYEDNLNGEDIREKFRIRLYNGSTDFMRLEVKRKEHGKTLKKSCPVTPEIVNSLVQGDDLEWDPCMHPLLKKLYVQQKLSGMQPKVIVEYDRMPFVCSDGNVRVTLDMNISASTEIERFMDHTVLTRPVMPIGKDLLEVKYDEFLPDYISRTVQVNRLQYTAFSKYFLCRKFGGVR